MIQNYNHKIRLRACGICIENNQILLVKHIGLGNPHFWSPVGGGVEFGETAQNALKREFLEESNLQIEVIRFLFVNEFVAPPLHAIELFFEVQIIGGTLKTGIDPEQEQQIISEVRFLSFEEIKAEKQGCVHKIFHFCQNLNDLLKIESLI
ncbi:MAG: NUDIX hydrolase [Bacteroidetes bacterium]|nr:MAG: NUDIX hydrolase [Bacteroidota bacterium]